MKKRFTLAFVGAMALTGYAQEYRNAFNEAFNEENDSVASLVLDQWFASNNADPEYYVARFNHELSLARTEQLGLMTEEPKGESFAIQDSAGNIVGFMGSYVSWDSSHVQPALEAIETGLQLNPDRLDMHFGYITFLGQLEDWAGFAQAIDASIQRSGVNKNQWLWTDNETFEEGADFVQFLQDYQVTLFDQQDFELLQYNEAIAKSVLKVYPEHVPSLTNLGVICYYQEDAECAMRYFQQAVDIDPSDLIVVFNLGYLYELSGDVSKAIATYELALTSDDQEAREQAKAIIAELSK
jgi:tetratricopeptide (TPR) repeat protein